MHTKRRTTEELTQTNLGGGIRPCSSKLEIAGIESIQLVNSALHAITIIQSLKKLPPVLVREKDCREVTDQVAVRVYILGFD